MRRWLPLLVSVLLSGFLLSLISSAQSEPARGLEPPPPTESRALTPGVAAAEAISTITGVAISPLLGVSAVGVWKYFKTPADRRASLPWFAQPWFWVPGLLVVVLCFLKDTAGAALPSAAKKPLDVLDAFENKISALIAAGAFVPLIATFLRSVDETAAGGAASGSFLAAIDFSPVLNAILIPLGVVAFLAVWMAAHTINILILISPFNTLDMALKASRTLLLSVLAGTALYDPVLGALLSMVVIFLSFLVAGWSFRMMVFGSVFAWDLITRRHRRARLSNAADCRSFLASRIQRTPIRTLGRLTKNERGQMQFEYRPWLVLGKRAIALPTGHYAVGRGLIHPVLLRVEGGQEKEFLWFPPRFAGHEESLARLYDLRGVHDVGLLRGFKAVWRWFKRLCGFGRLTTEPAAQWS